jgi:serine/threonine protein kinase
VRPTALAFRRQPPLTLLDFVLDLARNGEMKSLLNNLGSLSLPCARYYAAQLVDTIEYMHSKGVIHRYTPLSPLQ